METRTGFVEAQGHRLAYLAANEHLANDDEPAIIFIHGVLASVNFWTDCVPADMKENRAWYSLSLPAHHPSVAPESFTLGDVDEAWFFRLMNEAIQTLLGDRKAIIVGHSTGGFSALNLAINKAPNVVGIVSVAGFHSGKWGGVEGMLIKLAGLGQWARGLFTANIRISQASDVVRQTFAAQLAHDRKAFRASPLTQRMFDNIEANALLHNPAALFTLFNGIDSLEIADQLNRIDIPTYIFAGTHDPVVPPAQSLLLANEISGAQLVVFKDVGHMPFMEATDTYFAALERAIHNITHQQHSRELEKTGT